MLQDLPKRNQTTMTVSVPRYMVFDDVTYYPSGGFGDLIVWTDNLEIVKSILSGKRGSYENPYVVDLVESRNEWTGRRESKFTEQYQVVNTAGDWVDLPPDTMHLEIKPWNGWLSYCSGTEKFVVPPGSFRRKD
jgi:hypothetical protein